MRTPKIVFNFSSLADGALEDLALAVAAAMTGNPNFTEPQPGIAALNDSIKTFSDALALAKTRDKVKVATKNNLRAALEMTLRNLANYCAFVAKEDRAQLVSSGFPVSADSLSPKTLSAPENFTVQSGNHPGEVTVSINRIRAANAYLLLYKLASAENGAWAHATNSLPYFTLTGLESLQQYNFKMGAIGTRGQTVYTETITKGVI